jgi:hypothetical protein
MLPKITGQATNIPWSSFLSPPPLGFPVCSTFARLWTGPFSPGPSSLMALSLYASLSPSLSTCPGPRRPAPPSGRRTPTFPTAREIFRYSLVTGYMSTSTMTPLAKRAPSYKNNLIIGQSQSCRLNFNEISIAP